jgi:hypothetical protein
MEATAAKIGSKFPSGGGPATQAVTNEGVTVTVPTPKATLDKRASRSPEAQRNAERNGFRVVYTRIKWGRATN